MTSPPRKRSNLKKMTMSSIKRLRRRREALAEAAVEEAASEVESVKQSKRKDLVAKPMVKSLMRDHLNRLVATKSPKKKLSWSQRRPNKLLFSPSP